MILSNLTLTNFGTYRGRHSLSLEPRPKRPVVLLGGMNGAGKTTLFQAIQLCLYGPSSNGIRLSRDAYVSQLESRIHKSPNLLIQPNFASVELEFQYAEPGACRAYKVTRSWQRQGGRKLMEHLQVERDGQPLDELSAEHWEDFVRDLIPPGVLQFFFFDGEKIQHLAEDSSDQQMLAESIKGLLGLDVVERLQADLEIYLLRQNKQNGTGAKDEAIGSIENDHEEKRSRLAELRHRRDEHSSRLAHLQKAAQVAEAKIASQGGNLAKNREGLLEERARLKAEIQRAENSLRALCGGLLPFALAADVCLQLEQSLQCEAQAQQTRAARSFLQEARSKIEAALAAEDFWDPGIPRKQRTVIRKRLGEVMETSMALDTADVELVHNLPEQGRQQILGWLAQALGPVTRTAAEAAHEIEALSHQLARTQRGLAKIPNDEVLAPMLEELRGLYAELAEAGRQLATVNEEAQATEREVAELERRLKKAIEEISAVSKHSVALSRVLRAGSALEEYKTALIDRKVKQLQATVSDCFHRLCRKRDALQEIQIDPRDFSVTLLDRSGRSLRKAQLSAGEKQIFAISMLWALAKTSGRPLPIIIDTPLGRLDSAHRKLLVQHYFPAASHQVLILSTDTEVDYQYFQKLRPDIAHAYHLEFDEAEHATTVRSGYFWETSDEAH